MLDLKNADVVYECFDCGEKETVKRSKLRFFDGSSCGRCGGRLIPARPIIVGIDLAKGNDYTAIGGRVIENK